VKRFAALLFFIVIGALLTQGFQCSSPEMSTAKLAIKQQEWAKAEEYLDKELMKNPANGEAWIMLAEVQELQGKRKDALNSIDKGLPNIKDQNLIVRARILKFNLWANVYNEGIESYNEYFETDDRSKLEEAINDFEIAIRAKPQNFRTYSILGGAYEVAGDTAKAIEQFEKYIELIQPSLDLAEKNGFHIGADRADVVKALGEPTSTMGKRYNPATDSLLTDEFKVDGKDFFLYSAESKEGKFEVFGWKLDPPMDWLPNERESEVDISISPFADLAQIYFERQQYEKSLKYVDAIIKLEPNNDDAVNFMVSIYDIMGDTDRAEQVIKDKIKNNPKNKLFKAQYGDLLLKLKRYDEAIEQYQEALKIDPNYLNVKRNLGVAYKNKAVEIQNAQIEKSKTDDKYEADIEEYFPLLRESMKLFEDVKSSPKFSTDVNVINELINIYEVLDMKDKFKMLLAEYEAIESIVPDEQKQQYYINLIRIYDRNQESEKLEKTQKKYDNFNK
jgi:tetratricopeptide (TPR) repeat protein